MAALVPSMNRKRGAPFNVIQIINDAPPSSLMDSIASPKVKTMEGKELGVLFSSQHFGGRRVCWSSMMGLGRLISNSLTHTDLHKPNNKLVSA
jgi:hypothetical protein